MDSDFANGHYINKMMFLDSCDGLTNKEWLYILFKYIDSFTSDGNRESTSYRPENIEIYNGMVGMFLKQFNKDLQLFAEDKTDMYHKEMMKLKSLIGYQGKLYRMMHDYKKYYKNGQARTIHPIPKYDNMITHWSKSNDFKSIFHWIANDKPYTVIEANTGENIGIDVNKLYNLFGISNSFLSHENEVIFPMNKTFITREYKDIILDDYYKK